MAIGLDKRIVEASHILSFKSRSLWLFKFWSYVREAFCITRNFWNITTEILRAMLSNFVNKTFSYIIQRRMQKIVTHNFGNKLLAIVKSNGALVNSTSNSCIFVVLGVVFKHKKHSYLVKCPTKYKPNFSTFRLY